MNTTDTSERDRVFILSWASVRSPLIIGDYNNQNSEHPIPIVNRDEKRKKSLLLHKLDIYWGQLQPFLTDATVQDIINALHLNSNNCNPI